MPNARLTQLMKDKNIKPLNLPPPPKVKYLSGKDDPRLPSQIYNDIKDRNDVKDIVEFPGLKHGKKQYRVTFKKNSDFNISTFYI